MRMALKMPAALLTALSCLFAWVRQCMLFTIRLIDRWGLVDSFADHFDPLPFTMLEGGRREDPMLPRGHNLNAMADSLRLPRWFRMGAATAAFQIEGDIVDTNWNRWESLDTRPEGDRGPTVDRNEKSGAACDSWRRFDRDLALLRELGMQTYRFSIEWSRIEPTEGAFDDAALERYAECGAWSLERSSLERSTGRLLCGRPAIDTSARAALHTGCDRLKAAGIEPFVTLHHFTEPGWFVDKGGWEVSENAQCFGNFARYVAPRLATHCSHYITVNEPVGYAAAGWLGGVHPPGKMGDLIGLLRVCLSLVKAHKLASDALYNAAAARGLGAPLVVLASNYIWFACKASPWREPLSAAIAYLLNHVYNYAITDVCLYGRLPNWPLPMDLIAALIGLRSFARSCKGSINAIGVNHYFRLYVDVFRSTTPMMTTSGALVIQLPMGITLRAAADDRFEQSEMGWDLTPSSLGRVIRVIHKRYRSDVGTPIPIHITESGCCANTPGGKEAAVAVVSTGITMPASQLLVGRQPIGGGPAEGGRERGGSEEDEDMTRQRYLVGCLAAVQAEVDAGADVRTYMYWSLMDNFEWAEGFAKRFGLAATNYQTYELTPRPTATLYSQIISAQKL